MNSNQQIVNTFTNFAGIGIGTITLQRPVDVKRCTDYTTGTPKPTLLITDFGLNKVMEVTYPDGVLIWSYGYTTHLVWEAEKRPGTGTPTYLITDRGNNRVIQVQRTGPTSGNIIWQYPGPITPSPLNDPRDANWTPCNNVLITDTDNHRVIEVDPNTNNIVWQYEERYIPLEAIRIENNNTLIAGVYYADDNQNGIYPSQGTDVREIQQNTNVIVWSFSKDHAAFVDVEEKGIINIAKILYRNLANQEMPKVFAGVVVPIYQPIIIGTPTIIATKTVNPAGPQKPGATLTYTIVLTNIGQGIATNVRIIDQIPEGTKYVVNSATVPPAVDNTEYSHDGGVNYDASQTDPVTHIRWTINNLAPGASRTVNFSVVIE